MSVDNPVDMIFLVAAFVLAVLATIGVPSGRFSLLSASLACFYFTLIF